MVINTASKKLTPVQELKFIEKFDEQGFYTPKYNSYVFLGEKDFLEQLESIGAVVKHVSQDPDKFPPTFELISGDWSALHNQKSTADSPEKYLREREESKAFLLEFFEESMGADGTYRMPDEILNDNKDLIEEMEREKLISRPYKASYPYIVRILKP